MSMQDTFEPRGGKPVVDPVTGAVTFTNEDGNSETIYWDNATGELRATDGSGSSWLAGIAETAMASLYSAWTDGGTYDAANAFLTGASKNAGAEITYGSRAMEILNDLAKYAGTTADAWNEQASASWKKFGDLAGEIGSQGMVDPDLAKAAQNAKKWSDLAADMSALAKNSASSVDLTKAKWANASGALNAREWHRQHHGEGLVRPRGQRRSLHRELPLCRRHRVGPQQTALDANHGNGHGG